MKRDLGEEKVKEIIFSHLPDGYQVFLFGSRTKKKAFRYSDFDIGILGEKPVPLKILATIEGELEESDLPVVVDLVDFQRVSEKFKKGALKEAERWL